MSRLQIFFPLSIFFIPSLASAHVKWFVDYQYSIPTRPYLFSDLPVIFWVVVSLLILCAGFWIEKKLPVPAKILGFFHRSEDAIISFFTAFIGFGFIIFSIQGYVFAPVLIPQGSAGFFLLSTQAIIGVGMLLGIGVRFFAGMLLILYGASVLSFGIGEMIDALEVIGIACMLFILGRPRWSLFDIPVSFELLSRWKPYAIPLLRVFTGLNLIALGFNEKILHPSWSLAFLQTHPWNFMQIMGFHSYSDYWFVFSTGAVEALFGLVFVLGIVTRVNTIVLGCFFVTTLILLGPLELFGHILHFGIVAVLLIWGSGEKLKIS
ncbi:MAG: hypothetical protein AAB796_00550 [Patescibacteria group bacterium]